MRKTSSRLLPPSRIPDSLFLSREQLLILPTVLASSYITALNEYNLIETARGRDKNGKIFGGLSQDATDKHFAQQFDGSCARAQLAILDPNLKLGEASNTIIRRLAGNGLCLADLPCGAGAASLSALSVMAELRSRGVIPRMPLDVSIIAGDLSAPARKYADILYNEVSAALEAQAIFVKWQLVEWDVTDKRVNTDLVKTVIENRIGGKPLLLILANFTGFLIENGKFKLAERQLEELFRYASQPDSSAIWIEPSSNAATREGGLLPKLRNALGRWFGLGAAHDPTLYATHSTSSRFVSPIDERMTHRVSVSLMPIALERMNDKS